MKNLRIFVLAVLIFVFSAFSTQFNPNNTSPAVAASAPATTFSTSAAAMALIETTSGRVLAQKNSDQKRAMASTTKIVTALTVLENCHDLSQQVQVDDKAIGIEGTSIYLKKGEKLTVKELLLGLMLASGNDAATALAIHVGKSIAGFCDLMNKTAQKYGATNSHFSNPHGLDEKEHYTTAHDLAILTARALESEAFLQICSSKQAKIGEGENFRSLKNKNKLLSTLPGCIGVKTGFTNDAGRCLVSACERDGMRLVCVVLSCGPMFEESAALIEQAFKTYQNRQLLMPYTACQKVDVEGGAMPYVHTYTNLGFSYPLTQEEFLRINYEYDLPQTLKAPIKKQQKVGSVKIYLDEDLLFCENIYTMEEVNVLVATTWIKKIIKNWLN